MRMAGGRLQTVMWILITLVWRKMKMAGGLFEMEK